MEGVKGGGVGRGVLVLVCLRIDVKIEAALSGGEGALSLLLFRRRLSSSTLIIMYDEVMRVVNIHGIVRLLLLVLIVRVVG